MINMGFPQSPPQAQPFGGIGGQAQGALSALRGQMPIIGQLRNLWQQGGGQQGGFGNWPHNPQQPQPVSAPIVPGQGMPPPPGFASPGIASPMVGQSLGVPGATPAANGFGLPGY